jgi:Flp pilus assembly pilin Flp
MKMNHLKYNKGAAVTEYVLILALVVAIAVPLLITFREELAKKFTTITDAIKKQ